MPGSRHVTALVLGKPQTGDAGNWLEMGPRQAGVTVVSEGFARRRLPAGALEAMRAKPCFYMCVENLHATLAHVPGELVGEPAVAHGMREVCVETAAGLVVLAERV